MTEELLKALQLIKEECAKHETSCGGCPMKDLKGECGVTESNPEHWNLEKREVYF